MNILQLVPKLNIGGVEKGTVEVARYLTLNGHKAVVVSGGGVFENSLIAIGARHYKLDIGSKNPFVMIYCYIKLRDIIRKENIHIVHARSRVPALIGYFAAKSTNRIFLTTAHGQYKKHLISKVMGWGRLVIVANETMARYMKENFNVPLNKLVVIPRGVDLEKFSYIPPSERNKKIFKIGMISRFSPLKGHLDFLKAMSYVLRSYSNVEIILMGPKETAKEEYMRKIELAIRRYRMENIVKFKSASEDVAEAMKELNIFVSANQAQEAFGRTIIEAQARGVPVVATKVGGTLENVIDGSTGLVCEILNPLDMANKILKYMKDASFMEKVAQAARRHVEERYALDRSLKMTLDTYLRVLNMRNILIFKISSLGDIILSTPSIRAIRKRFPNGAIKVLTDVRFREVLERCPYIDEVITCDFRGRDRFFGFLRLAAKLGLEDFDISMDLQNNRRSHLLAFLSRVKERYGYNNGKWSFFLNRKIDPPEKSISPVEHQAYVLSLLGITHVENRLELWPDEESELWAYRFLGDNWIKSDQKIVAVSLSASRRWKTKNWDISLMANLVDRLAKEKGIRTLLLGSDEDKVLSAAFLKKTSAKPIDAVSRTDIPQLISLIKRSSVLVTGDSAPMHIAAGVGTPFVALFGPTDPIRHLPPAGERIVLYKKMDCSPCYKSECDKRVKCVSSIKVQEVYEAVVELLG